MGESATGLRGANCARRCERRLRPSFFHLLYGGIGGQFSPRKYGLLTPSCNGSTWQMNNSQPCTRWFRNQPPSLCATDGRSDYFSPSSNLLQFWISCQTFRRRISRRISRIPWWIVSFICRVRGGWTNQTSWLVKSQKTRKLLFLRFYFITITWRIKSFPEWLWTMESKYGLVQSRSKRLQKHCWNIGHFLTKT